MAINIQNLLSQIFVLYEKHKILENEQCLGFNIFSILNIERKEVETHSLFIYELLNPKGAHNQNEIFLDLFLKNVLALEDYGEIINGTVKREDPTRHGRRIDFTIETSRYQIAIEMKIDAGDENKQLHDYFIEMDERTRLSGDIKQESKLYYLTLTGSSASKKSLGNVNDEEYICISFSDHILKWVELCIKESAGTPVVRELLFQYKILLEKITNQDKGLKMDTIKIIGDNKENFIAAYEIHKSFEDMATRIEMNFWNTLIGELKKRNDISFILEGIKEDKVRQARVSGSEINIIFNIGKLSDNEELKMQVGTKTSWGHGSIYATIFQETDGKWDDDRHKNKPHEKILELVRKINTVNFKKASWCYGTAIINEDIELRSEKLYEADNYIHDLSGTISEIIQKLKKNFVYLDSNGSMDT